MARKTTAKRGAQGGESSSRSQAEIEEEEYEEEMENLEEEHELRVGRKTRQQLTLEKEAKWVKDMPGRGFKNERQIDLDSLSADFPGMQAIIQRGMRFWFNPLNGFNKKAVVEFYQKMVVTIDTSGGGHDEIKAKLGRHYVVVTPDRIAKYLGYRRPDPSSLAYPGMIVPSEAVIEELYEDERDYKGTLRSGYFKEEYRLLNKAIQANLFPRVSGHRLTKGMAELLYIFKHVEYPMDCALWIFNQLLEFRSKGTAASNIPFPCMITHFCRIDGVTGGGYEVIEELEPGLIDKQGMLKSRSQSKPTTQTTDPSSSHGASLSRPAPKPKNKLKDLLKRIFCQTVAIRTEQRATKKRQIRLEKKQDRAAHERAWQTQQIEGLTNAKYVPPVEEEEEEEVQEEWPLMSNSEEEEE